MPTVQKLPKAYEDLFEIWDFIAADNTAAADSWIDKLDAEFLLLASHPLMSLPKTYGLFRLDGT